jgi:NHL repeat-containing protein
MRSPVAKASHTSRRQRSALATLLLASALVLALGGAQAQAAPKGVVDFFGEAGTGAGQFNTPRGVAANESTGHLYVVDSSNHRVQEFDAFGTFVRAWGYGVQTGSTTAFEICNAPGPCMAGKTGPGAGQLANPQGIAVDQDSGAVYVTNQNNRRIEKFDSSGNFLFAFGWNVDPTGGSGQLETCTTASTCQAAVSGADAGRFATTFSGHVAVDPRNGDVVVADPGNRRVQKFDSAGAFLFAFGWDVDPSGGSGQLETCTTASTCKAGLAGSGVGQFITNTPTRVAVDSSGSVYTVEGGNNRRVQKFNATASSAAIFAPQHTSGADPFTAPTDVAVDPGNDHVLVAKDRQVLEFDIAGTLTDTHAAGAGLPAANGMAVDTETERIYLSTTPNQRIFVLGQITPPSATISPVTDVAAESATFHGTVNPNGGSLSTGYHFEYSDDGGFTWTSVPIPDVDVGNGTSDVPVSEAVTGLEPNTAYRVRLVASRPFAGGSATSATIPDDEGNPVPVTFTTEPAPPDISGVGAREITDISAVLGGRVDPNHSQTTYQFEYGTDTSYGNATPVDSAGSGASSVAVSKQITGLRPNTTYHFRLVATNPVGETEGDDNTFTTAANPPQPSGRAYEMVSPLDKNGGNIERDVNTVVLSNQTGAAGSGGAVAFVSRANFGDADSGAALLNTPNYLARRGHDGWMTEGITPPVDDNFPGGQIQAPRVTGLMLDASRSFGVSGASLTPEAERLNGSQGLYMRSAGQAADQRYTLLSAPSETLVAESNNAVVGLRFEWEASTPDTHHVIFTSSRQLLPPDAPPDTFFNAPNALYEWVDGTLRLASELPTGVALASNGTVFAGGGTGHMRFSADGQTHGDHVISDDGGRVFFSADTSSAGRQLFVREDGATTRVVSASERPGDPPLNPAANPGFWAAKATDGSVAFFTSGALLTADAVVTPVGGPMLYRWDATAPDGQRLSAISPDPLGAPGVLGPAAVSDDAATVYFVALGELAPGATRGEPNLYLWRQGEGVRFVATLDGTSAGANTVVDAPLWLQVWRDRGGRGARVSPNGERLLFASYAQLDPAYDTVEESAEDCGDPDVAGERCRQIYLYDAPSGRISCLTCVAGSPVTGDANLFGNSDPRRWSGNLTNKVSAPLTLPRNLSTDGRRAFFETARQLVTADQNNAIDTYEWEDSNLDGQGELRLISTGRNATDSKFLDASLSGDDVFFTARDRLVGIDTDNQVDLYDARVGGGIAAQNPAPAPPPCEGDDCQGTLSGAPFLPGVGSGGATHGNVSPGPRPTFSVARLSREQRAQLARGRRVLVRVRTNRAGSVRLAARAKLGGRMRTVAAASKTARKAGSLKLSVKLTRAALRELTRKGKLKLTLAVKFAGVREARNSTLRLRRARGAAERRPR